MGCFGHLREHWVRMDPETLCIRTAVDCFVCSSVKELWQELIQSCKYVNTNVWASPLMGTAWVQTDPKIVSTVAAVDWLHLWGTFGKN